MDNIELEKNDITYEGYSRYKYRNKETSWEVAHRLAPFV
jgi:hypothetical protein